jgi:hypothetical protein
MTFVLLRVLVFASAVAYAITLPNLAFGQSSYEWGPHAESEFPTLLGVGADLKAWGWFETTLTLGLAPKLYTDLAADTISAISGDPDKKAVAQDVFAEAWALHWTGAYNFSDDGGWHVGVGVSYYHSTSRENIDPIEGATLDEFSGLKSLLQSSGLSNTLNITSTFMIAEIYGGYAWRTSPNWLFNVDLGAAKILLPNVQLSSDLPAYDSSASGSDTLRTTQKDINSLLNLYGIFPTLTLSVTYFL